MGCFMEHFSLMYLITEKHGEIKKDTHPLSSTSAKKTKRDKECAAFGCSNAFYNTGTATGLYLFKVSSLLSKISRWFNLIKRQNSRDAFYISLSIVLCCHYFIEADIKNHL